MSHEFDSGLFVGTPAWHGLGVVVQEAPTTAEALKLAQMDWSVTETDLTPVECPGWKRLNRSDTGALLHVCRANWTPVQNVDAFRWFDPLIQDGDVALETAVSLAGGKRIAILARIQGSTAEVLPGDSVEQFLLLFNSHDGSLALGVKFTNTRVVCQNTLGMATQGEHSSFSGEMTWNGKSARIKHTRNIQSNLEAVRDAIDIQKRGWRYTLEEYQAMAKTPMTTALFRTYLERVFEKDLRKSKKSREGVPVSASDLMWYPDLENNFDAGIGINIPGVSGTVWAGYQAVSEFFTHQRGRSQSSRLDNQWFGAGQKTLTEAHDQALVLTRS
ncbi:MAG: DUF932 domain-containing protein [Elainellaceae cyanobacterium]